jgi:D-alanine-D-alanine ligase
VEGDWGASLGWPLVVKPADQGSTVGFSLVEDPANVPEALSEAARFGDRVLIEEYVAGRELTVAVVDNRALPVIEISPSHGVYDYECKYTPGMSSYECPADLPGETSLRLQEEALKAFTMLMHSDYSRMDFRLSEEGVPYLLEGNTLPGFTATSLVPKAAAAAGIEFGELCSLLVEASLKRHGERRQGEMTP